MRETLPGDAVKAIEDIEQRLAKAWVERDQAAIDAVLAADWSVTDGSGQVLTKQQVMQESFTSTDRRIDRMVVDEVKVRVYVFVWRSGRWQAVVSHGSMVAQ